MEPNFPDKNKSHLIRLTDVQKKKARRRLIGSLFLLLIALIILLNVTSRVTPVEVEQKKLDVEIKNTASKPVPSVNTSQPIAANNSESPIMVGANASQPAKDNASGAPVVAPVSAESTTTRTLTLKPRIVADMPKTSKPSPEDILNGIEGGANAKPSRYYVQLIASSDKDKLIHFQNALANQGVKTTIQSVDTPNGTVYRLRVGPFTNKDEANNMLKTINGITDTDTLEK